MKILMMGWEFPPFFAGGAGMVCKELTQSLNDLGVEVTFVMPKGPEHVYEKLNEKTPENFTIKIASKFEKTTFVPIKSLLTAYTSKQEYQEKKQSIDNSDADSSLYGGNLKEEIYRFADVVEAMFEEEDFDVIHAHDWVTFPAATRLKEKTNNPLVTHVHITEYDKSGGLHADPFIHSIEKKGMDMSDKIVTVSNRIKSRIVSHYYQEENKVDVVHNAPLPMKDGNQAKTFFHSLGQRIVLFAGRITLQKGPEFFVEAATIALQHDEDILFVVAGSGDKLGEIMERVAQRGLSKHFLFTGFYTREDAVKLFSMADLFVMPSVSEPFGIVPYEAQVQKTPTIISKQSGIAEVLEHTFRVDFWDTHRMAELILCLANYETLNNEMRMNGYREAKNTTWHEPAQKCIDVYNEVM